jgi:alkylhydroperoxidase family enzyme
MRAQPDDPVLIDVGRLQDAADEEAYGLALSQMLFRPDDIAPFYRQAVALAQNRELRSISGSTSAPLRGSTLFAGSRSAIRTVTSALRRSHTCSCRAT